MKFLLSLLVVTLLAVAPSRAVVVFGNLDSDGSRGLGNTSFGIDPTARLAQGFTTGVSFTTLDYITLGLHATGLTPLPGYTINLYSDIAGVPGSSLAASAPLTISPTPAVKYNFDFNFALSPNTTYWVVPSTGVDWHVNANPPIPATPQAYNGSGYSDAGTLEGVGLASWGPASSTRFSISLSVPEPSTYVAGALLLCGAVVTVVRRRCAAVARG